MLQITELTNESAIADAQLYSDVRAEELYEQKFSRTIFSDRDTSQKRERKQ